MSNKSIGLCYSWVHVHQYEFEEDYYYAPSTLTHHPTSSSLFVLTSGIQPCYLEHLNISSVHTNGHICCVWVSCFYNHAKTEKNERK